MKDALKAFAVLTLALFSTGCAEDPIQPEPTPPFQELYNQGIDKYLGVYTPTSSSAVSGGATQHTFSGLDNPICFTGNAFSMFTRAGSSNKLLIFLQGGGFCGPMACDAVQSGIPLLPFGMLSTMDPQNPVANYDLGYVPYCDGSAMMGDQAVDSDSDGVNDRFFMGLKNLSASLDVIVGQYPSPDQIVVAGNSAGGFAVHAALPLARKLYPDVPILLINDSGVGILDPGAFQTLRDYWNAGVFFPTSCTTCIGADGNLTDYHKYQLAEDSNMQLAYISSKQDTTIAAGLAGGGLTLETELIAASNALNTAYPDRFQCLIGNGEFHTSLLRAYDRPIGSTTVRQWLDAMINDNTTWNSIIE